MRRSTAGQSAHVNSPIKIGHGRSEPFGRPIGVSVGEVVEREGFVFADILAAC
jgi:hypothetical protein